MAGAAALAGNFFSSGPVCCQKVGRGACRDAVAGARRAFGDSTSWSAAPGSMTPSVSNSRRPISAKSLQRNLFPCCSDALRVRSAHRRSRRVVNVGSRLRSPVGAEPLDMPRRRAASCRPANGRWHWRTHGCVNCGARRCDTPLYRRWFDSQPSAAARGGRTIGALRNRLRRAGRGWRRHRLSRLATRHI